MNPEQVPSGERRAELKPEELEAQPERVERSAEASSKPVAERAHEQVEQARTKIERQPEYQPASHETATTEKPPPTRLDLKLAYGQTLKSVQRRLNPVSRRFSRGIHAPAVERVSEVTAKTVLRPSISLGASLSALMVGGVFYYTAKHYGFQLSGSEFLLAILLGGIIGGALELITKSLGKIRRR